MLGARGFPLAVCCGAALVCSGVSAAQTTKPTLTRHDKQVIRFFHHHPRLARTAAGGKALAAVLPHVVEALRSLEDTTPEYPPHHALWECIAKYEAVHVPVSPSHPDGLDWQADAGQRLAHGGGMGFSYNWGHGLIGEAGNYTEAQQEWAAERGYEAAGYSGSFLYGQWYDWDAADGCGT